MSRTRKAAAEAARILLPLLILAAGIFAFVQLGEKPARTESREDRSAEPVVETAVAVPFDGGFTLQIEGVATPYRQITLSAEVAGRIVEKAPRSRAGSYVSRGDELYRIDETDYTLEVERLETQLDQSTEDLAAVDVDLTSNASLVTLLEEELQLRRRELARQEDLMKKSASSERDLDEARTLELSTRNSLQTLRNETATLNQRKRTLEAARALVEVALRKARVDLERTRITSPLDGTVIRDEVEENDYVKVGDPLIRISDASKMEVKCNLRLDELAWVWAQSPLRRADASLPERLEIPSTPVQVVFPFAGSEYVWKGVLSRYEGIGLDEATRTVPCRVLVDRPNDVSTASGSNAPDLPAPPSLFAGMYVKVRIPIDPPDPLLEMPGTAVQPGNQAWVLSGGTLRITDVDVARRIDGTVLIRPTEDGVRPGDRVIVSPLAAVADGMAVKEAPTP